MDTNVNVKEHMDLILRFLSATEEEVYPRFIEPCRNNTGLYCPVSNQGGVSMAIVVDPSEVRIGINPSGANVYMRSDPGDRIAGLVVSRVLASLTGSPDGTVFILITNGLSLAAAREIVLRAVTIANRLRVAIKNGSIQVAIDNILATMEQEIANVQAVI